MSLSKIAKERLEKGIKAKKLFDEAIHFGVLGGDPRKEITMLNKVIGLDPEAYWAYVTKAFLLNTIAQPGSKDYAKHTEEARSCLATAFEIKPDSPQVVYAKCKIELKEASKTETDSVMRHVLELPAATLRDHIAQARAYKVLCAKDLEIRKYQELSQIPEYAESLEVWYNLGQGLDDGKRFGEAVVAYEHVTTIDPKYANGWIALGNSLMDDKGRNLEAEAAFRTALKLAPKNLSGLHNLAVTLSTQTKYEESMKVEKQILKYDPSNASAHFGISSDIKNIANRDLTSKPKAYQKQLEKALVENNKALAQEPDDILYLAGKADTLVGLKRSGEALDIILNVDELLKHMTAAEKAELHGVLPFIEGVLAHKAALVVDLKLTDQALQDMVEAIVGLHDSGTEDHDGLAGVNSSLDSGDSDHSQ